MTKITIDPLTGLNVPLNPTIPYIAGDGVGPELFSCALKIFDMAVSRVYKGERRIEWLEIYAGDKAKALFGEELPEKTLETIKEYKVAIKGPLTTPIGKGIRSLNVAIRQKLDLFAGIRPIRYFNGAPSPMRHPERVNMVIFRENTEDLYAGIEWERGSLECQRLKRILDKEFSLQVKEDAGLGLKIISESKTRAIMRMAIQYALKNSYKSITIVHKGNIMKFTEGAFMEWAYNLAKEEFADFITIEGEEKKGGDQKKLLIKDRLADNMFQQILTRPQDYQVIVAPNLNGDYLSEALAAQIGGVGLAPSGNLGDNIAVFEPTHGTAPQYVGMDKINPCSLILSGAMLFEHIRWNEVSLLIYTAIESLIKKGIVTYDLARHMGSGAKEVRTTEFSNKLIEYLLDR